MDKVRILQVMPEFGLAGAEIMCETLCYQLQASGKYNVVVVSLFDFHSPITERMEDRGIKILYLGKKQGLDLSVIQKLYRVMKDYRIDIVHTHRYVMQYTIPAAILARVKVRIHTVYNIASKEVEGYRKKLAYWFYKFNNVVPISISPLIQNTVVEQYHITKSQTPVVYNGSDLHRCLVKHDYVASKPFRIVHIGRFNPQKNHGAIIEAAEILKRDGIDIHINLIGGAGNEESRKLEVKQKDLTDMIEFSGLQSNVYPFLKEADCFILPSLYEGMPVTLVEAMGCGVPIIASSVGGIPDMIEDGVSGLLIHPIATDLASAIKKLIIDDVFREQIGKNARNRSKQFSAEQMYEGYDKIYMSKWQ